MEETMYRWSNLAPKHNRKKNLDHDPTLLVLDRCPKLRTFIWPFVRFMS